MAKNQLLAIMKNLGLPTNLLSWTWSFLNERKLRLAFDGQVQHFSEVETGIPQGSPTSPILFLIYIRDLFPNLATRLFSYIDDIALAVSSTSIKKNIRILEREAAKIFSLGERNAVEFDPGKTELVHFLRRYLRPRDPLRLLNGATIQLKEVVKWLGIWFDRKLDFKVHISTRVNQARSAFLRLSRLVNTERGLSPRAIRQLYIACVVSVGDYGA